MIPDDPPPTDPVLVLDTDGQAALWLLRSLGRRGVPVTAGGSSPHTVGMLSKYATGRYQHPPVTDDAERFVEHLESHLGERDYLAVVPTADDTTAVLSRYKDRLAATGTTVAVEDWGRFRTTYDKAETFALAADLDVPTPGTYAPESVDAVRDVAERASFPVVVKSRSKHVWDGDDRLHLDRVGDGNYARTPDELVATFRGLLEDRTHFREHPPVVQEYVDGETTTTVGLADDGDLVAYFQELRLRTQPASGGNSTLITGMRSERMREYAESVVDALEWTGPLQVEFMRTPNGEYYLIEVNGRYWGSLPLAIASGVDVPWRHLRQLRSMDGGVDDCYRTDVVQQRLFYGDLKWLREMLEDGRPGAVAPFARSLVCDDQVFASLDDPLPSLGTLADAATTGGRFALRAARAQFESTDG